MYPMRMSEEIDPLALRDRMIGILARKMDPVYWPELVILAAVQAKEEIEGERGDARTTPGIGGRT